MKEYKEKLKTTRVILAIAVLILFAFTVLSVLSECGVIHFAPVAGDGHWQSRWRGFVCGASVGIGAMILVGLIRISKAMGDEKELKKLYVKENDERQRQIYISARSLAMQIFLIFGLVAGIVVGYFNVAVSITVLACVTIHSLIGLMCKLYYSRKY